MLIRPIHRGDQGGLFEPVFNEYCTRIKFCGLNFRVFGLQENLWGINFCGHRGVVGTIIVNINFRVKLTAVSFELFHHCTFKSFHVVKLGISLVYTGKNCLCTWVHFFFKNQWSWQTAKVFQWIGTSLSMCETFLPQTICNIWYAKEKEEREKNLTNVAIYHGALLVTMGDYLTNNILLL